MVQTARLVMIRIQERKCHLNLGQIDKSLIAYHCWMKGHQAGFTDIKIIYCSDNLQKQIISESLEIALAKHSINQEEEGMPQCRQVIVLW